MQQELVINLIDVGGQRSERKKWSLIFNSVDAVIFVASLIEFNQVLEEDGVTNRFEETLKLFSQVSHHSQLKSTMLIVFLNKKDIMSKKLKKVSYKSYYQGFDGDEANMDDVVSYIKTQMEEKSDGRVIYTHVTCATDAKNVEFVFDAVNDSVINLSMTNIGLQ